MITAIALLMDKNSRESVHTLALFSSAVLILMLDSFLFSLITGTQVPSEGDRRGICAIAWTQGAVSTGMLAAGATALFGGLGWMLASHAVKKVSEQEAEDAGAYSFLADLGGWLTFAATMTTTLTCPRRLSTIYISCSVVDQICGRPASSSRVPRYSSLRISRWCMSEPRNCASRWPTAPSRPVSRFARSKSPP
ncbi:MAG: hypothetical protein ACXWZX_15245 [Mycobacterium sp.]